jgi:hypothetical protein
MYSIFGYFSAYPKEFFRRFCVIENKLFQFNLTMSTSNSVQEEKEKGEKRYELHLISYSFFVGLGVDEGGGCVASPPPLWHNMAKESRL